MNSIVFSDDIHFKTEKNDALNTKMTRKIQCWLTNWEIYVISNNGNHTK